MDNLVKSFSTPIIWVLSLMILGLILTRNARKKSGLKTGWYSMFLGTLTLIFFSMTPVSKALVYSLERMYQPPSAEALSNLDFVVVLGGGAAPSGGFRKNSEASGATYSRLFNGVEAFKQSSAKILVLSGLGPYARSESESEAEVMKTLALRLGVGKAKIVTEAKSRNTMQQAIELARLFPPTKYRRIGITTSALHMFRAEKTLRKKFPEGAIVPIPVNYVYSPLRYNVKSFIPSAGAFSNSTNVIHEWIGILWYSIRY